MLNRADRSIGRSLAWHSSEACEQAVKRSELAERESVSPSQDQRCKRLRVRVPVSPLQPFCFGKSAGGKTDSNPRVRLRMNFLRKFSEGPKTYWSCRITSNSTNFEVEATSKSSRQSRSVRYKSLSFRKKGLCISQRNVLLKSTLLEW